MKASFGILAVCLVLVSSAFAGEKLGDWKPLFDGKTTKGWRGFKKQEFPKQGWTVENGGVLHLSDKAKAGDIITDASYDEFELAFDWKVAKGANSGVKYFILEERGQAIGHEYQLIDDQEHPDAKKSAKRVTASFYDVVAPSNAHPKAPGDWNESRVLVHGNHVEHWLNGSKTVEYELGSADIKKAIAESKFKDVKGFGEKVKGHILLQDHGDEVWFRNIKIRLPETASASAK